MPVLNKRPELHKWSLGFYINKDFMRLESFSREVTIHCFKPHQKPPEGAQWRPIDYKGFIFSFRFWFPITVDRWR